MCWGAFSEKGTDLIILTHDSLHQLIRLELLIKEHPDIPLILIMDNATPVTKAVAKWWARPTCWASTSFFFPLFNPFKLGWSRWKFTKKKRLYKYILRNILPIQSGYWRLSWQGEIYFQWTGKTLLNPNSSYLKIRIHDREVYAGFSTSWKTVSLNYHTIHQ